MSELDKTPENSPREFDDARATYSSFRERLASGEAIDFEELCRVHPALAGALRDLHSLAQSTFDKMDGMVKPQGTFPRLHKLGNYRILREIGQGGMGIVYEAEDEILNRRVALKVLLSPSLFNASARERFRREAQAAARLHHTNIVPLFGVGEEGGVQYIAMQYIEGRSLDRVIDGLVEERALRGVSLNSSASRAHYFNAARMVLQAAEALTHAHVEGIIHRDIKPSNLLVDGRGCVWVTDFGLAKTEGTGGLTYSGDIVGTLAYMAPERFSGRCDARSDIYALGLTLYELLTLRPAFHAKDRSRLIKSVLEDEPPRPRKIDPGVPRDLETIALKAMAKEPVQRYATASEMAQDLSRFIVGETVKARPLSAPIRALRWCRRKPAQAGLIVAIVAVACASTGGYVQTVRARDGEASERRKAQAHLYESLVGEARATRLARLEGYRERSWGLLDEARRLNVPGSDVDALRQEAVLCMGDFIGVAPITVTAVPGTLGAVTAYPRSTRILVGTREGGVFLTDGVSPNQFEKVTEHGAGVTSLLLGGREDNVLFSADTSGEVQMLETQGGSTWALIKKLSFGREVRPLVCDPACTRIVVRGGGSDLYAYGIQSGAEIWKATFEKGRLRGSSASPEGKLIASGYFHRDDDESGLMVWRADDGALLKKVATSLVYPYATAFSADSGLLAGGFDDGVEVYETKAFTKVGLLRTTWVPWLQFHPQSSLLAYRSADSIFLWSPTVNQVVGQLRHPTSIPWSSGGFGAGGKLLVSGERRSVRVWRVFETPERRTLLGHEGGVPGLAFSPDGRLLASAGKDRVVRLWNVDSGDPAGVIHGFGGQVQTVDFSPDGLLLAAGDWSDTLQIWSLNPLESLSIWNPSLDDIWRVCFSSDGELFAASGAAGLCLWRLSAIRKERIKGAGMHEPMARLSKEEVREVRFSGEGLLAWVEGAKTLRVLELGAMRELAQEEPNLLQNILCLAFLPGGRLAFINTEGSLEVWDVRGGMRLGASSGPGPFRHGHVSVSRDGALLAGLTQDSTLSLWDLITRRQLLLLPTERAGIWCFDWSPDRRKLAVGLNDGGVFLWDLLEVRRQLGSHGLDGGLQAIGLSHVEWPR